MTGGFQSLHCLSFSLVILNNQPSLSDLFSDSSFPLLKKLSLDACFGLKHLHVGCRALEDLNLENCFQLQGLDVSCAKLDRLRVASCFDGYVGKSWVKINAPRLRIVVWEDNSVSVGLLQEEDLSVTKLQSVSNLLLGLSHARCLTLESQFVEV